MMTTVAPAKALLAHAKPKERAKNAAEILEVIDFFILISSLLRFLQAEEGDGFFQARHAAGFDSAVGISATNHDFVEAAFQVHLLGPVWQLFTGEAFRGAVRERADLLNHRLGFGVGGLSQSLGRFIKDDLFGGDVLFWAVLLAWFLMFSCSWF
jgi:hypothetical protein